jgi:hypothetical protein
MKQSSDVQNPSEAPIPRAFTYYRLIDSPQGQERLGNSSKSWRRAQSTSRMK